MKTFKTILVTEDLNGSSSETKDRGERVRNFAASFAKRLNTNVVLFHGLDLISLAPELPIPSEVTETIITASRSDLKEFASKMGPNTEAFLYQGPPIVGILDQANEKSIELIVQGSQAKRGIKRAIVGSVAEEVIRQSKVPVITLGPNADLIENKDPLRVLVATDLGSNSVPAEEYALKLGKALDAEIILSHCPYRGLESGFRSSLGVPYIPIFTEALYQRHVERSREKLSQKADEINRKGVRCQPRFKDNELFPADSLLGDIQKEKPFLVVMGTHGRNLFSSFYFGSTTREMLLSSPVPVLTVRSI